MTVKCKEFHNRGHTERSGSTEEGQTDSGGREGGREESFPEETGLIRDVKNEKISRQKEGNSTAVRKNRLKWRQCEQGAEMGKRTPEMRGRFQRALGPMMLSPNMS